MKRARRVLIFAGGTGGHVMPALAVAMRLRECGAEVAWVGTQRGIESRVAPRAGFAFHRIHISGVRGRGWWRYAFLPAQLAWAAVQSLWIFARRKPDCVLGMGGFVAGPGGVVAALLRRPLVLHEQNTVAGMTNRHLARRATRVLCGFPKVDGIKTADCVGNPVRAELLRAPPPKKPTPRAGALRVLVVGGSLGAHIFNERLPELLGRAGAPLEVWHQCGGAPAGKIGERYLAAGIGNVVSGFIDDIDEAYAWCDLAICRAGAVTIAELCAAGVASFLVPYPHAAGGHQKCNAEYLRAHRAARVVSQEDFVRGEWLGELAALHRARKKLLSMAQAAHRLARPHAAREVAHICLQCAEARHA